MTPLEYVLYIMNTEPDFVMPVLVQNTWRELKADCARAAAPYIHPVIRRTTITTKRDIVFRIDPDDAE